MGILKPQSAIPSTPMPIYQSLRSLTTGTPLVTVVPFPDSSATKTITLQPLVDKPEQIYNNFQELISNVRNPCEFIDHLLPANSVTYQHSGHKHNKRKEPDVEELGNFNKGL